MFSLQFRLESRLESLVNQGCKVINFTRKTLNLKFGKAVQLYKARFFCFTDSLPHSEDFSIDFIKLISFSRDKMRFYRMNGV